MAVYPWHSNPYSIPAWQMHDNAIYIWVYMQGDGWSINAIAAMLGNMQHESGINPGRWQKYGVTSLGYGLVQWSPATKLINWAQSLGMYPSHLPTQIARIHYEYDNGIQWSTYAGGDHDIQSMTFSEFKTSAADVRFLAKMFAIKYERSASIIENPDGASAEARANKAQYWWEYLTGNTYEPPTPPDPPQGGEPYIPFSRSNLIFYLKRKGRIV